MDALHKGILKPRIRAHELYPCRPLGGVRASLRAVADDHLRNEGVDASLLRCQDSVSVRERIRYFEPADGTVFYEYRGADLAIVENGIGYGDLLENRPGVVKDEKLGSAFFDEGEVALRPSMDVTVTGFEMLTVSLAL